MSQTAARLSAFGTRHEPHVAEQIFLQMLGEAGVSDIRYGVELATVTLSADGAVVKSLAFTSDAPVAAAATAAATAGATTGAPAGAPATASNATTSTITTVISAAYFVDATYEGDLMAQATAGWTIGREGTRPSSHFALSNFVSSILSERLILC